jgi:hypothetical protein
MVRVSEDDILLEEATIQYAEIVLTLDGIRIITASRASRFFV